MNVIANGLTCSESSLVDGHTDSLRQSVAVIRVDLVEESEHTFLDRSLSLRKRTGQVLDQVLSVGLAEDLVPENSRLLERSVGMLIGISSSLTSHGKLVPSVLGISDRTVLSVRLIVGRRTEVTVDNGGTISDVMSSASTVRAVDRNLLVVLAKSVTMSVRIREETTLEHLVVGGLNAGHKMARRESGLLNFGVVVLRVAVQSHLANSMKRIVGVRPDLGDVEDIESVVLSILLGHELDVPGPAGEVTLLDGVIEITS